MQSRTLQLGWIIVAFLAAFPQGSSASVVETPKRPSEFPLLIAPPGQPLHAVVWGDTNYRQAYIPPGLTNLVQISTHPNGYHTLALSSDGGVVAWGRTNHHRCDVPLSATNVVQVAAGGSHSLALRSDGTVVSWGKDIPGQLEVPPDLPPVVQIAGGGSHSLALLQDGSVFAWGDNSAGQCEVPPDLSNVVQVAAGGDFNLALKSDGTVSGWGSYYDDEGNALPFPMPVNLTNIVKVSAGSSHWLAITSDGTVVTGGAKTSGQCDVPNGLSNVVDVAAGALNSLALTAAGNVIGWGENGSRQSEPPVYLTNAVQITAGALHSAALASPSSQWISNPPLPASVNFSNVSLLNFPAPVAFAASRSNIPTGLPVSVAVSSGPAQLEGNSLKFTNAGTVIISMTVPGDGYYLPSSTNWTILSTVPKSQSLSFPPSLYIAYTNGVVSLSGTSSSGLPLSYVVADDRIATVLGESLSPKGAGTTSITVNQGGNYSSALTGDVSGLWLPASPITVPLVITRGPQSVNFPALPNQPVGASLNLPLLPVSSSGLPVSVVVKSGPATISGITLSLTGAGTVVLSATQSGDVNYLPSPEALSSFLCISPQSQTISFGSQSFTFSKNPVSLSGISSSGLPVGYYVSDSNVAVASNGTLLLRGIGSTTILATQVGNADIGSTSFTNAFWSPAQPVTVSLVVTKGVQQISPFPDLEPIGTNSVYDLGRLTNLTSSSGLPLTFSILSGPGTLSSNNLITPTGTGRIVIVARQPGNDFYNPSDSVTNSLYVRKNQSLTKFFQIAPVIFKPKLTLSLKAPAATSKLPVTVSSLTPDLCTVAPSGKALLILGGGTISLTAEQIGNTNFAAADPVFTTFVVRPAAQALSKLTFKNVVFRKSLVVPFVTPKATSGLPVSITVVSEKTTADAVYTTLDGTNNSVAVFSSGSVFLSAVQSGNNSYQSVTNFYSFNIVKAPQTLTFSRIPDVLLTRGSIAITNFPTSTSGLPVILAAKSGPTRIGPVTNGLISFTNRGTITLTADQPGNQNYLPAKQVAVSFKVK